MGLNERRKMKELQEVTFPARVKEIKAIDWESLADDGEALNDIDNLSCHCLNMTVGMIRQDDLGKAAVAGGLKQIKLKNVKDKSSMHRGFQGGVLEMRCAYALHTGGMLSDGEIRKTLERTRRS